ncbi:hypothetical protein PRIPAC_70687 [Pristionchus pacificus]|uniref:Gluconokinase n=1 Tax=Pristionchus pacificus TaxID=54126 RepID=A0A8R1ZBV7_PRIPA|nr:hypothetical protein PRIPAC_70687 [Pristionchus pacificus]
MNWDTIIVMGVAGCGKSTVAEEISKRLRLTTIEGDQFHPSRNIEKMKNGIPLNDDDRFPWLRSIRDEIGRHSTVIVSCSALKQSYRNILSENRRCLFVLLDVSRDELIHRLQNRRDHFFHSSLLDSQLSILEKPKENEGALIIQVSQSTTVDTIADRVVQYLMS